MDNRTYRNLKSRLTRAINSKDPNKVLAECDRAFALFDTDGPWPDDWHRWNIARQDAEFEIRRQEAGIGTLRLRR